MERLPSSMLNRVALAYNVPLIDYERPGDALLISVGSGLMMASMDAMPRCRWCLDAGGMRDPTPLTSLLVFASRIVDLIVVNAWYSISSPRVLSDALRAGSRVPLIIRSNVPLFLDEDDVPSDTFIANPMSWDDLVESVATFPTSTVEV